MRDRRAGLVVTASLLMGGCSLIDAAGTDDSGAPSPGDCALTDDFEDGVTAALWQPWNEDGATAREQDGALSVSFTSLDGAFAGYDLDSAIDLREGEVRVEVAAVGGEFTVLELDLGTMAVSLYVEDGDVLSAQVAGTADADDWVATDYLPESDVIWRIRGEGGFVHLETSDDGEGWDSIYSTEAPFPLDQVVVSIAAGGVDGDPPAAFESFAARPTGCAQ